MRNTPIERPHILIRCGPAGRTIVLRLVASCHRCYPLRYTVWRGKAGTCRVCGCTRRYRCLGGCTWVDAAKTICSRCATAQGPL